MTDLDTHQTEAVLIAARSAAESEDWTLVVELLGPIATSLELDDIGTEARYRSGDAHWRLGDLDSAFGLILGLSSMGSGPYAEQAEAHFAELMRHYEATEAADDGVSPEELDGVINGAGEALMRGDFAAALPLYEKAWSLPGIEEHRLAVIAEGMARCLRHVGRVDEAEEWFGWILANADSMYHEAANAELAAIAALDGALAAADDGTQAAEVDAAITAGDAAQAAGDSEAAVGLYHSVLANPTLQPEVRARALFNLGQAHIKLHDYDAGRAALEQAAALGVGGRTDEYIAERLGMLDQMADGLDVAELLEAEVAAP